jgi:hypothetical protein
MTGIFSLGNVTGLAALVALAMGIVWAMVAKNQPVVSVAAMLRDRGR